MRTLLVVAVFMAATPRTDVDVPPPLQALLDGGAWDSTPLSFRVIALSHLADGCAQEARLSPLAREAAQRCVKQALARAMAVADEAPGLEHGALWKTHVALILGASDAVGPCADPALHEALSRTLAHSSLTDRYAHAPSYASMSFRWPADQAATLAALRRFDVAHGGRRSVAPLQRWEHVMAGKMNATWGLPMSEVTGEGLGAAYPRGCAQSFLTRYLAEVDPALSAHWWAAYRRHFLVRVGGLPGFREWPPGVTRAPDEDSGPVVLGVGAAASAFAIAAAKSQGDATLALELESAARAAIAVGAGGPSADTLLARAILYQAATQPRLAH